MTSHSSVEKRFALDQPSAVVKHFAEMDEDVNACTENTLAATGEIPRQRLGMTRRSRPGRHDGRSGDGGKIRYLRTKPMWSSPAFLAMASTFATAW